MSYRFSILIITLSLIFPLGVYAEHIADSDHAGHQVQLPLNQESAAELIRSETGEKVLSVVKDKSFFRVKTISDQGRVKIYRVSASTGKIVE